MEVHRRDKTQQCLRTFSLPPCCFPLPAPPICPIKRAPASSILPRSHPCSSYQTLPHHHLPTCSDPRLKSMLTPRFSSCPSSRSISFSTSSLTASRPLDTPEVDASAASALHTRVGERAWCSRRDVGQGKSEGCGWPHRHFIARHHSTANSSFSGSACLQRLTNS